MKKTLLVLGLIFIAITAGIFIYLTFFKVEILETTQINISGDSTTATDIKISQQTQERQTNGGAISEVNTNKETGGTATELGIPQRRFTQLTNEPVVGMVFISTSTARYLTRGSSLIKDVSLVSGNTLSSVDTNITDIIDASFSADGDMLLVTFIDTSSRRYFMGTIQTNTRGEKTFRGSLLPENTIDASFSGVNGVVRYTLSVSGGSEIHTYTPKSKTDTISATLPYSNTLLAASILTNTYYTYPTPTSELMGSIQNQNNGYVTGGGRGLTAYNFGEGILVSKYHTDGNIYSSAIIDGVEFGIPTTLKTDACTPNISTTKTLICGSSFSWSSGFKYPDDWYKGINRFEDDIIEIDIESQSSFLIGSPMRETGISFDILKIQNNSRLAGVYLLINKNNGYLWMFQDI